jgi:hypothetical protein
MSTPGTDKQPSLWLFVKSERSHGYFHLRASVCTDSRERNPQERERFPYGCSDRYQGPYYSGLEAGCQGDSGSQKSPDRGTAVYGFNQLEYRDEHSIDLGKAERMVKTLKAIERKLAKLAEVRGYARTYPEYIGRLAEVLGAKGIVVERSQQSREMTGERYEWLSVGDGINRAANLIWQWQREALGSEVQA